MIRACSLDLRLARTRPSSTQAIAISSSRQIPFHLRVHRQVRLDASTSRILTARLPRLPSTNPPPIINSGMVRAGAILAHAFPALGTGHARTEHRKRLSTHISPALGRLRLSEVDKFCCQVFLNDLAARGFSFSLVDYNRAKRQLRRNWAIISKSKAPLGAGCFGKVKPRRPPSRLRLSFPT